MIRCSNKMWELIETHVDANTFTELYCLSNSSFDVNFSARKSSEYLIKLGCILDTLPILMNLISCFNSFKRTLSTA